MELFGGIKIAFVKQSKLIGLFRSKIFITALYSVLGILMILVSLAVAYAQDDASNITFTTSKQFVTADLTPDHAVNYVDYTMMFLIVALLGVTGLILLLIKLLLSPLNTNKQVKNKTNKHLKQSKNPFFEMNKPSLKAEKTIGSSVRYFNPEKEIDKELGLTADKKEAAIEQKTNSKEYEESIPKRMEQQSKLEHDFEQFLKEDEKEVVNILKLKDGSCDQGTIQMLTNYSKAKVSDLVKELESRRIIIKRKKGRKNIIILRSFSN